MKLNIIKDELSLLSFFEDVSKECLAEVCASGSNDSAVSKWTQKLKFWVEPMFARKFLIEAGLERAEVKAKSISELHQAVFWIGAWNRFEVQNAVEGIEI